MKRILVIEIFILTTSLIGVAHSGPFSGPRPIAIIIEQNPWLMVMGSDTPSMALYEDGTFIFTEKSNKVWSTGQNNLTLSP